MVGSKVGGRGGCEPGIEVIVKMQKSRGVQVGCERRIEVIVEMKKKSGGGGGPVEGGGVVRVVVNKEFSYYENAKKFRGCLGLVVGRSGWMLVIVKMQNKKVRVGAPGPDGCQVRGWSGGVGWLVVRLVGGRG